MPPQDIEFDENGIPVLQKPVQVDEVAISQEPPPAADLTDHERVVQLLEEPAIQQVLDDITEDLQKLVSWKVESLLKEEVAKLIREATENSASRLSQDIRTHLQLALPELLAKVARQARGE